MTANTPDQDTIDSLMRHFDEIDDKRRVRVAKAKGQRRIKADRPAR